MGDDTWAGLAGKFADEAYASVKGYVRTYVMHHQLLEHLPPPATVLDLSPAMLGKARQRLKQLTVEAQQRVTLLQADGLNADAAVDGRRFAAVLCHGGATGYGTPVGGRPGSI